MNSIEGRAAPLEAALDRAASLLAGARYPLVAGLGADVAGTQNMPKASGKKKWWSLRKQEDASGASGATGTTGAASSPDADTEKEVTR